MPLVSYLDCLEEATRNVELVTEFNRLTGFRLGESALRSPVQMLIDETTGYDEVVFEKEAFAFRQFALFVKDLWLRLPADTRREPCWTPSGEFELPAAQGTVA